jgi:hypothetical protein
MRNSLIASLTVAAFAFVPNVASAGGHCGKGRQCFELVETPPAYQTIEENVLVAPARHVRHHVPAVLDEVTEAVVVRPERTIARHVPAEYGVVQERVMTHAGGKQWVVQRDAYGRLVGCWVHTGPSYATVARRVKLRDSGVTYETLPAIVSHRTRTVVVERARTEVEHIPAQYETRARQVQVSNGGAYWQAIGSSGGCGGGRGLFGSNCR